ncbi:Sodium/calcium exchanger 2, partial [Perkinsus olseni]
MDLTDDAVIRIIQAERPPRATRAQHRIHASRLLTGRAGSMRHITAKRSPTGHLMPFKDTVDNTAEGASRGGPTQPTIDFTCPRFAVMEGAGRVLLPLTISRPLEKEVMVRYETVQGTATAGEDYIPVVDGRVTIKAGETSSSDIAIVVLDDDIVEEDENFWVRLTTVSDGAVIGKVAVAEVT